MEEAAVAASETGRFSSRFLTLGVVAAVIAGAAVFAPSALATTLTCADSTVDVTAAGPSAITPDCSSDGSPIQGYFVTQSPSHGTAQGNTTNLTYTPQAAGYDGVDSFQYVAYTDFTGDPSTATTSNTVTVTLNVSAPPAPVTHLTCNGSSTVDVTSAGPTTITPDCSSDGTPIQGYYILQSPSHGTAQGNATNLTYTPQASGYDGADSFQYLAYTDFTGDPSTATTSNTVTVTVNVSAPANQPPICPDSQVFVVPGSYVDAQGYCVDPDGDPVTYGMAQSPTAGLMAYLPASDPPAVRYWPCTGPNEPNETDAPDWPGNFLIFSTCSSATGPTTSDQFVFTANDSYNPALQVHVGITVGDPVPPGQPATYSTGADATPSDPYQASVTTDQPGGVLVATRDTTTPPPTGYQLLNQEFRIEAPPAESASNPLRLVFTVDGSQLDGNPITVFRNGVAVQPCDDQSGTASPDPCALSTETISGDVRITVLTTHASIWNFGVSSGYDFTGFLSPVNDPPTANLAKAGSAIPVKFSLNGNQGLDVFDAGYPKSQVIDCNALSTANVDGIESTVSSGASQLSYDAASDQYSYAWKSDKAWAGTCRQLVVRFNDQAQNVYRANFKFK